MTVGDRLGRLGQGFLKDIIQIHVLPQVAADALSDMGFEGVREAGDQLPPGLPVPIAGPGKQVLNVLWGGHRGLHS
jgi:hypothetical protein